MIHFDPGYEATHKLRYELSMEFLRAHLHPAMEVLELGGPSSFSEKLAKLHPLFLNVARTDGDLRYWANSINDYYDLALCMEVIEHIHDQEADTPTEWRSTGTTAMLRATRAALKPGGLLFVSTPNACSFHMIWRLLTMQAPAIYRPHVREYAPAELVAMVEAAGFEVVEFMTRDCWGGGNLTKFQQTALENLTKNTETVSPHRGECMFLLAKRR